MAQQKSQKTFDLYGNLGRDPEPHSIPAKSGVSLAYDEIIDDVVERPYDLPERNFLTLTLATGGYDDKPLRWHYCIDWNGVCFHYRKGDRVKLHGHFEVRTYEQDGEEKTIRQFVVQSAQLLKTKVREEVS